MHPDLEIDACTLHFEISIDKKYTFTLADTVLPPEPNTGREQATVVYEYDFQLNPSNSSHASNTTTNSTSASGTTTAAAAVVTTKTESGSEAGTKIFIPWDAFTATYRGRVKEDAPPLDRRGIKRMSLLIRRYAILDFSHALLPTLHLSSLVLKFFTTMSLLLPLFELAG